ncbi:MAG: ABC transporter permease [Bacteroidales bacterium]
MQNTKIAIRNLLKSRLVTVINILGLTVGITVSLLCFMYVRKEKTTDRFISDYQNIYVLTNKGNSHFSIPMVNLVKKYVPELKEVTYCDEEWSPQIFFKSNHISYPIKKMLVADSCFFRVFTFKPLWGNPLTALNSTNRIVITRSLAKKMFGNENPVGKSIEYNTTYLNGELVEIAAVLDDLPQNSSWDFEAVVSIQTNCKIKGYLSNFERWGTRNYRAFVRTDETLTGEALNKILADVPLNEVPDNLRSNIILGARPFKDVYFEMPDLEFMRHGNLFALLVLKTVGILILLLACTNYINLVTAQREKRFKSVGILKTFGGGRSRIISLMTVESALVVAFAILLSVGISILLLNSFNSLTQSRFIVESFFSVSNLFIVVCLFFATVFISGLVPGVIFSRYKPALLLKNQPGKTSGNSLRNGLLVFQFIISIALISGIIVINRQNRYLNSVNPGFQKENIVFANTNADIKKNIQALQNELSKIPQIVDIAFSGEPIGQMEENWSVNFMNKGEENEIGFAKFTVSPNFFNFFGIPVIEGSSFSKNSFEKQDWIFNEKAAREFNVSNLADARIVSSNPANGAIVGIVGNFNFESMHVPLRSAAFSCTNQCSNIIYLKLGVSDFNSINKTLESVHKIWDKLSPNFPFEPQFIDASWSNLYAREKQFQQILLFTTLVSLILSCLGLIGLTFFIMERRTKEIGICKVNGATVSEVMIMLNKSFVKLIAIAFVIATPIDVYVTHRWLENFAYKTTLNWWIFALAGLLALFIALLTVSWLSWRAATRNPVEALRYE